jgi:hypothetical protein
LRRGLTCADYFNRDDCESEWISTLWTFFNGSTRFSGLTFQGLTYLIQG